MNYDNFKKIIESCHLNFLIGSGASKPYLGTLGSIEKLLTDLSALDCDEEKKQVIEASIKKHYFDIAIKGNVSLDINDLNLDQTKSSYKTFIDSLNTILLRRKSNLISKQVNLFTTNIDLLLDYTLEKCKVNFNDGFTGRLNPTFGTENYHNTIRKVSTHYEYQSEVSLFNLHKIHGSLNWILEDQKILYDYNLSLLEGGNKLKIDNKDFLTIEYKDKKGEWVCYTIDELSKKYENNKLSKKNIHDTFLKAYNKFVMINPTKEKFETTTLNLTYYELLRMYSNQLEKENSVLFVFGFSFADEHIREITKRVSVSNPTLLIVIFAYSKQAKAEIEKVIPSNSNIKIIAIDSDTTFYSLETINSFFFQKLAEELQINMSINGR